MREDPPRAAPALRRSDRRSAWAETGQVLGPGTGRLPSRVAGAPRLWWSFTPSPSRSHPFGGVLPSRPLGGAAPTYAPKPLRAAGDCPLELRFALCFLLFLPLSQQIDESLTPALGAQETEITEDSRGP